MLQVAAPIWNEIAETQELATPWARKAFRMKPQQMCDLQDKEYEEMTARGVLPLIALATLMVKPLMLEARAIAGYLTDSNRPDMMSALPLVETPEEAAGLAALEYNLTPAQTRMVAQQLRLVQRQQQA